MIRGALIPPSRFVGTMRIRFSVRCLRGPSSKPRCPPLSANPENRAWPCPAAGDSESTQNHRTTSQGHMQKYLPLSPSPRPPAALRLFFMQPLWELLLFNTIATASCVTMTCEAILLWKSQLKICEDTRYALSFIFPSRCRHSQRLPACSGPACGSSIRVSVFGTNRYAPQNAETDEPPGAT